jgi:hypothetical protein
MQTLLTSMRTNLAQQEAFVGKADWVSFKQQFFMNATPFGGKGLFRGSVKADFNKEDKSYVKKIRCYARDSSWTTILRRRLTDRR